MTTRSGENADGDVEIQLLGEVIVLVDGCEVDAGPDRQRCVLVALAVDAGRMVSVERLATIARRLWRCTNATPTWRAGPPRWTASGTSSTAPAITTGRCATTGTPTAYDQSRTAAQLILGEVVRSK